MPTSIQVLDDTIKIDKVFVSGKDRVAVNGQVVFEGKLAPSTPKTIAAGNREYVIETRLVSRMMGTTTVHLKVLENDQEVHSGLYDQTGKPLQNEQQAGSSSAIQACAVVGAVIGVAVMLSLNMTTGVVPGGAIGGAIGGGCGAALGQLVGTMLFKRE
jgi:hypothetical protein